MTEETITQMIEEMNLPFAYHHFAEGEAPQLPYLIYLYPESIEFSADSKVYAKGTVLRIELYSEIRDIGAERRIESVLDSYEMFYHKEELFIDSERLFEVMYEMEVPVMG